MEDPVFTTTLRLVAEAKAGDGDSLGQLLERYTPRIRRIVALRMGWRLRQIAEHEDIMQEALLKVFQGLDRFEARSEGSFRHWVANCVECAIKDCLRNANRMKRGGGAVRRFSDLGGEGLASSIFQGDAPTPSQELSAREFEEKIEECLLQLAPSARQLIILKSFCEMSHAEVAAAMGLKNENTARQSYFHAVRKLKDLLSRSGRAPSPGPARRCPNRD